MATTVEFKFEVGQIVKHRLGDFRAVIIERMACECSGGVQNFYRLRYRGDDRLVTELTTLHEIELEELPKKPFTNTHDVFDTMARIKEEFVAKSDFGSADIIRQAMNLLKPLLKQS